MQNEDPILRHNRQAWDRLVASKSRFTEVAVEQAFSDPLRAVDQAGWLGESIAGKRVLCLAAGGGRQGPLYAAAGARVTVLDISEEMLRLDRQVASERKLKMNIVQGSMDDLSMFSPGEFEIVIHPVSTCYLPQILPVYQQVARVLGSGGLYVSQHKTPGSLQASRELKEGHYVLEHGYYDKNPLEPAEQSSTFRERGTLEFVHRWEEILGGLCRAGFVIEDVVEPYHAKEDATLGGFAHRCSWVAPYVRIKARRIGKQANAGLIL